MHKRIEKVKTPYEKTNIQNQTSATDKAIDKLVYELYELTEEEIKIVETTIKLKKHLLIMDKITDKNKDVSENKAKFKGYRCFKDNYAGFDKIMPVNIIIGCNNSGKSCLLDLTPIYTAVLTDTNYAVHSIRNGLLSNQGTFTD